jgi:hypothetical protein
MRSGHREHLDGKGASRPLLTALNRGFSPRRFAISARKGGIFARLAYVPFYREGYPDSAPIERPQEDASPWCRAALEIGGGLWQKGSRGIECGLVYNYALRFLVDVAYVELVRASEPRSPL